MKHYSILPLGHTVTHTAGEPSQTSDEDLECKPCGRMAEQVGQFRGENWSFCGDEMAIARNWPVKDHWRTMLKTTGLTAGKISITIY